MKSAVNFQMLQQVYNFMAVKPNFTTQGEVDLLLDFFSEIQFDHQASARLGTSSKIFGKFGKREMININLAPSIRNKNDFLKWVYRELNR